MTITLRFVWNVPTDPAARAFTLEVPTAEAAADTINLYSDDDRTFVVHAEDAEGGYRGGALVGGGRPTRVRIA